MKIKKIIKVNRNKEDVFNLTVKDNHNYFVNGVLVSNCHNTESEVINFLTLTINTDELHKYNIRKHITFPHESDSIKEKFDWLTKDAYKIFNKLYNEDFEDLGQLTPGSSEYINLTKRLGFIENIISGINMAKTYNAKMNNGICIQNGKVEITFKPIFGKYFATKYLLDYADKVLAMSATVFDKKQFCKDLGVDEKDAIFISCDSPIPSDRRPVINLDAVNLSYQYKEENKPILLNIIKEIMSHHLNERGIIHTVNYDIAKYIIDNMNSDRLIMPKGKERQSMIEYFKNSKRNDLILISPSLTEGISLDDDLSRFTVVCKIPYGNLGDPWIKERMNRDGRWYENETIQTLVQMTGRSVRSKEDFAVAYILDSSFNWFYNKTRDRFPKWWRTSLEENE